MALKTTAFDVADYLTDAEEVFHYLDAELETNEPEFLADALESVARARGGVERLAAETGVPASLLSTAAAMDPAAVRETTVKVMEAFRAKISATQVA